MRSRLVIEIMASSKLAVAFPLPTRLEEAAVTVGRIGVTAARMGKKRALSL
jgi:hypothetical protein